MRLRLLGLLVGLTAVACSAEGEDLAGVAESPIVYGEDGRTDVYAAKPDLAAIARRSVVALFDSGDLDVSNPSDVKVAPRTLGEAEGLCRGQRFAEQPAAASCSGTLIAEDLVLTAGHCFDDEGGATPATVCRRTKLAFNYFYEAEDTLARITRDDVFACAELLAYANDDADAATTHDYAILRLDRPAVGYAPIRPRPGASPARGQRLIVAGAPSGLPLKIEATGRVLDPRAAKPDYFTANTDTFEGNSGSGVFDADTLSLVGILVRGSGDDYVRRGSCNVVNAACRGPDCSEDVQRLTPALAALCRAHPALGLCR